MDFEHWLTAEGLSPSSVKKYARAIDGALTKWGIENEVISKPLREIGSPSEFAAAARLIEGTEIFSHRNARGNHMYGAALKNYAQYVAFVVQTIPSKDMSAGPFSDQIPAIAHGDEAALEFDPTDQEDGRQRVLRDVVRRQGQPKFRTKLIAAYEGRCAITRCPILPILEAAHVTPYLGPQTNGVANGILLRADIHTLWDLGLIAIHPNSVKVSISPTVQAADYQALDGKIVFQPSDKNSRISCRSLHQQWQVFQRNLGKCV